MVAPTGSRPPVLMNVSRRWSGGTDVTDLAALVHTAGLDGVGLPDSPRLMSDCLVETERVLSSVPVKLAGPSVLSLGLRPPATAASAVRTLHEAHPDRVMLVVGRGESSLHNEGLPIPTLAQYERLQTDLVGALEDTAERVVLLGAASGPRTIASSAAILGGVMLDAGTEISVIRRAVEHARAANPAAKIWVFTRIVLGGTEQDRSAAVDPVIGSCATRVVRAPEWYGIEPAMRDEIAQLVASYDYRRHGEAQTLGDERLAHAASLVRDRFFIVGDRTAAVEHLQQLADLDVDGIIVAGLPGVVQRAAEVGTCVESAFG